MANQSIGEVLYTIYCTCRDKIDDVLFFYYSADALFKKAAHDFGDEFLRTSEIREQTLAQWRQFYMKAHTDNLPLAPETHLDDINALYESYLKKTGKTIISLEYSRDLLCKLCLVYVVGLFEAYFTDSVEQLVSESQLNKFKNLSLKNQVSYLQNNIGISIDESQVKISEIDEFFARRNLLLHCGGKVDKRYIERVGYSPYKEGEEIPVDEEYFLRAAYSFKELAGYLYRVFKAKTEGNYGTPA